MLADCPRPLLITPSKSIKSGKVAAAYDEEREHWRIRDDYAWIAYEYIQRPDYIDYLDNYRPGLLVLDEAHHAGRYDTSRTARIGAYLRDNPEVPCIVLTGSLIASRVVNDSLTLCAWARREHTPLPLPSAKLTQRFWKLALDTPQRAEPGALRAWCRRGESSVAGVGRRYYETPGVVCSSGENVIGTSLAADTQLIRSLEPKVTEAFAHVRKGLAPDGSELLDTDGRRTWLVSQTLALGFYYVYDPEPPPDWLDAWRNWCSYYREHVRSGDCRCDTEKKVKEHIDASDSECWPLAEWLDIKSSYKLQRKAIWLGNDAIHRAAKWLDKHPHGIVWTQFPAFGARLAASTGRPYYHTNARDKRSGRSITEHPKGEPCIASLSTCSEDLNLQRQFCDNLYVAPPGTGAHIEQSTARTHRYGSTFDEVTSTFWLACAENRDNLSVAKGRERSAAEMTGDSSRKMLIADWTQATLRNLTGPQWAKTKIAKELKR